jgi:hypothetical protein
MRSSALARAARAIQTRDRSELLTPRESFAQHRRFVNGKVEDSVGTTTQAVWKPQANNPYYRITELVLPPWATTGPQRFEFKATLLPHTAGQLRFKSQGQERHTEIVAGLPFEIERKTENEIVNTTDKQLEFTVMEVK